MGLLVGDVSLCLICDRIMKFIFCRHILLASIADATVWDVLKLGRTVGVIFFLMNMFLGNNETWDELMRQEELLMNETAVAESVGNTSGTGSEIVILISVCLLKTNISFGY